MILVLTPLTIEHAALVKSMAQAGPTPEENLQLAVGGHGKVQFALTTQLLIQKHNPRLVICAGACGSLNPDLRQGDVVVADSTLEHDFKLKFVSRPLPEFHGDTTTLETLRRRAEFEAFRVHFGPIASGDEDIIEPERARLLRRETGALCVAWEGAGGARAARLHGVPFVEIRVITDTADTNSIEDFTKNVGLYMDHVAQVIRLLV